MSLLLRSLAKGTVKNFGKPTGVGASARVAPASASVSSVKSFFTTLNQKPGECQWNTPSGPKPCNMPPPLEENGIVVVKLPPGTKLYHATVIHKGKPAWFNEPLTESRRDRMWFASTPEHAKQMNWTHLLEYEAEEEITLQFIQNLTTHAEVTTGHQYVEGEKYRVNRKLAKEKKVHLDGYAGCNECEYMLLRGAFRKLSAARQIDYKSPRFLGGFWRTRKTRKIRKIR